MKAQVKAIQTGTYLIPNLLTAFNLVCGILAILLALEDFYRDHSYLVVGHRLHNLPAWLVLAAMVFDYLDGKVARWTHTETSFGVKVDSLTDFVSFGIAPVVIAYFTLMRNIPIYFQYLACGLYLFAGAWRLARFNCEAENYSGSYAYFTGLPIPAASAFICTMVLVLPGSEGPATKLLGRSLSSLPPTLASGLVAVLLMVLAFLMVSRIPFPAFKVINRRNLLILGGSAIFFGVLLLALSLESIMFLIMLLYIIIGLFSYFHTRILLQNKAGINQIKKWEAQESKKR